MKYELPFYYSDEWKKYEIEYLNSNGHKVIKDLSNYIENTQSIILLCQYNTKYVLRGYRDGIIFPTPTNFNIENIHIKKRISKIQKIFDEINQIFKTENIVILKFTKNLFHVTNLDIPFSHY